MAQASIVVKKFKLVWPGQADVLMDKRLVVVIDAWDADSAYPAGHYVRTLGVIGDRDAETEVQPKCQS